MEYLKIIDFLGNTIEGFILKSRKCIPKRAKLLKYTYDQNYNEVSIYTTLKKTYIFVKKVCE